MTAREAVEILGAAILWLCALASPATRNWRFLSVLAGLTVLLASAEALSGSLRTIVTVGVAALAVAAFFLARQLGLGSFTGADDAAYTAVERLESALDDPAGPSRAADILPTLDSGVFTRATNTWANVARLYRLHVARILEPPGPVPEAGFTPSWAYRRAARDYARASYSRRVIAGEPRPSAWDEEVLLRCLAEQLHRTAVASRLRDESSPQVRHLAENAERIIEAARDVPLRFRTSRELRRVLVEWMMAFAAVEGGDRSAAAIAREDATAAAVAQAWPRLAPSQQRGICDAQ